MLGELRGSRCTGSRGICGWEHSELSVKRLVKF